MSRHLRERVSFLSRNVRHRIALITSTRGEIDELAVIEAEAYERNASVGGSVCRRYRRDAIDSAGNPDTIFHDKADRSSGRRAERGRLACVRLGHQPRGVNFVVHHDERTEVSRLLTDRTEMGSFAKLLRFLESRGEAPSSPKKNNEKPLTTPRL